MSDEPKVKPLTQKTMTLSELQLRTLDVLRKVRFQFNRLAHEDGMSDAEFLDSVVSPLETVICQDRMVSKMHRKAKKGKENTP